jgi:D-glycerate 3-kinase
MSALELIARHILDQLSKQIPLFVALQGPQGSGKSYLSARLQTYLQAQSLRVAVLSIDDLYLPHQGLTSLAASHPSNPLWQGRGQPGTHDIDLGVEILSALKTANKRVELPRFDKSLFGGEGDRLPMDGSGTVVEQPPAVDVVVFEGWCVGFHPIPEYELLSRWNGVWKQEKAMLGLGENQMGRLEDLEAINEKLKSYLKLWTFFDVFVRVRSDFFVFFKALRQLFQLKALPPANTQLSQYAIVYKWRLEQEHNMKARNGGQGLTDAAVKSFVYPY